MVNISQSLGGKPVWFLRYNPDTYQKAGGRKKVEGESRNKRHQTLLSWLKFCLEKQPPGFVAAYYLYFDGWKGSGGLEPFILLQYQA
jgi:hypothetical protein